MSLLKTKYQILNWYPIDKPWKEKRPSFLFFLSKIWKNCQHRLWMVPFCAKNWTNQNNFHEKKPDESNLTSNLTKMTLNIIKRILYGLLIYLCTTCLHAFRISQPTFFHLDRGLSSKCAKIDIYYFYLDNVPYYYMALTWYFDTLREN